MRRMLLVGTMLLALLGCGSAPATDPDGGTQTARDGGRPGTTDAGPIIEPPPVEGDRVAYAGPGASARFHTAFLLSDGTLLIGGIATELGWVGDAEVIELAGVTTDSRASSVAFLLHLDADLSRVRRVVRFPAGTVQDVSRIRSTNVPGAPTGALYVSGRRDGASEDGYFIARLNGNFVDAVPSAVAWIFDVGAPPRRAGGGTGESAYETIQPWDVDAEGRVIYGHGSEYDFDWAAIGALDASGRPAVVEHWPIHWSSEGEHHHVAASSVGVPIRESGIVLKAGRRGSLRSHSAEDYAFVGSDGNGRTDRPGRWPDDYFFSGPCEASGCASGPGHTGYRTSDKPTQRLGGIAIDRRNGAMYFGYSTQSVLPGGNPDFEPAVVGMDAEGRLLWWSRLYEETDANSTPDQYVDGVEIDYANDQLVVLARAHGNNVVNLWEGNEIAANPEASGFQNRFTGNNGNIHISWLGKLELATGTLRHATYVAEYTNDTTRLGAPFGSDRPHLEGWPNPNDGWPDVNTTRCAGLSVDAVGRVLLTCQGRRTITTRGAYQEMLLPGEGESAWNAFARVYTADLGDLVYSSLVVGAWDPLSMEGGGNTTLDEVIPLGGGLLAVGHHGVADDGTAAGSPVPTTAVPSWAASTPEGLTALFALLRTE